MVHRAEKIKTALSTVEWRTEWCQSWCFQYFYESEYPQNTEDERSCINHIFVFSLFLNALGPHMPWRDLPSRDGQFLEIVKNLPASVTFIYKRTSRALAPQLPPFPDSHISSYYPPCPNPLRTRHQTTQDIPYTPEITEIIQSSQS